MPTLGRRLSLGALAVCAACAGVTSPRDTGTQPPVLDVLPRPLTGDERSTIAAANDFSLKLFATVSAAQRDGNVFISPLSASMALGMATNGATGATYDQMLAALSLSGASQSQIDAGYKELIGLLHDLDPAVTLGVANSVWYRNDFPFRQSFLDVVSASFEARVSALDFASPASVGTINAWVNDATAGKIPSIVDRIAPTDAMFLINAIYFKGRWRDRFDPGQTRVASFHGVGGDQQVPLMQRAGRIGYFATADLQAAELPYGNAAYNMVVLLPAPGRSVETLAMTLQAAPSLLSTDQFHQTDVDFAMPRFRLAWERELNSDLVVLGMHDAFVPNGADFTRMSTLGRQLFISVVKQKTFVDVNEEGTEAAAVTNVGIGVTSAPVRPVMHVDRPFIFVIRERLSGTVLFMGKIVTVPG